MPGGGSLAEAFQSCGLAMFNYMSSLEHVREVQEWCAARLHCGVVEMKGCGPTSRVRPRVCRDYGEVSGHDLPSLLFAFLEELLFVFQTELFIAGRLRITRLDAAQHTLAVRG
jgi:SHS2 domain-containing protein